MSATLKLSLEEAEAANLAALHRIDKEIVKILATASHVALYTFDGATKTWQKRNIDGSLHVVKLLNGGMRMIVNNRNSPTAVVQDVTPSLEFQTKPPYLMYREGGDDSKPVQGIWFHDPKEIKDVVRAIKANLPTASSVGKTAEVTISATESKPHAIPETSNAGVIAQALSVSTLFNSVIPSVPTSTAPVAPVHAAPAPASAVENGTVAGAGFLGHQSPYASFPAPQLGSLFPMSAPAAAPMPTHAPSAIPSGSPISPPVAALGDVNILLTKSQLKTVLMDLVQDDSFVSMLHQRYVQNVVQQTLHK